MDIDNIRSWKLQVASGASWMVAGCVCVISVVSIVRIGVSVGKLCILSAGLAQLAINGIWGAVGYRIAAVELLLLALLSLPFFFAFGDGPEELQMAFGWRVAMFGLSAVLFVGLAGLCLSEATAVSAGALRR